MDNRSTQAAVSAASAAPSPAPSPFAKNLGAVDRMIHAIVGVLIMGIGFQFFDAQKTNSNPIGLVFVGIGFLAFLAAPLSWDPLYVLLHRNTFDGPAAG